VFKIFWGRITNEAQRFSCPIGWFLVALCESFPVGLYHVKCLLSCVQHKEGSVGGVMIEETTLTLCKDDVLVGLDHVKLVVVLAVVSYWELSINL
jgi:hypothetical protein